MKIGIDASRANREQRTGVENYAFNIIQELKKIVPEEIQVVLYSEVALQGELAVLPKKWQSKILRWPPKRLWTQFRMSLEMLVNPPDVLFIPAHVFPIIHSKKTVMMVHDIAAVKFPGSYNWFERFYSVWSARLALKKLWRIIVPSEFVKEELLLSSKFKIQRSNKVQNSNDKVFVIHHGVDDKFGKMDSKKNIEQILNKYNLKKPFIMSIGRLEEKKNTRRIVEAFDILKKNNNWKLEIGNWKLLLIGKPGYGYEKVKEAIDSSPYKNDIIIPGFVSDEDLPYLLNSAEVFVFPSLYEGFGLPVLEAMACGVPVVASSGNCLEEVGGDAAVYANPKSAEEIAEAIRKFLTDETFKREKIAKGLERIKMFSWENSAKGTLAVLLGKN